MEAVLIWLTKNGPQAIVVGGIYLLLANQLRGLTKTVEEIKDAIPLCQKERRDTEGALHSRVTDTVDRVSKLEGRLNG